MAVGLDTIGTKQVGSSQVTTTTYSGITVGSGSNRALLVFLALGSGNSSGWSATWDDGGSNQVMTNVSSLVSGSYNTIVIFALRNPTPGQKTLGLSWTGSLYPTIAAIAFTDVEQSSDANAFTNANSNTSTSLAVTSAVGDKAIGAIACTNFTSYNNQTPIFYDDTSSGADGAAQYADGAASVTFTLSGSGNVAHVGINVVAATTQSVDLTPANLLDDVASVGEPTITIFTSINIGDQVCDFGLNALTTDCDGIYITSQAPTSYADATSTHAVARKLFTRGTAFGAPDVGSSGGRTVTSVPITDGTIIANSAVETHWVAVDSTTSRILAYGQISGSTSVTTGHDFSLGAVTVHIWN